MTKAAINSRASAALAIRRAMRVNAVRELLHDGSTKRLVAITTASGDMRAKQCPIATGSAKPHYIACPPSAPMAASWLRHGNRLGGVDLADLPYAERQAQDALKAETAARAEASRAISRLRINAHDQWSAGHQSGGQ